MCDVSPRGALKIDRGSRFGHHAGMAMGKRGDEQEGLFVAYNQLPRSMGHPFYQALDRQLRNRNFDRFVEDLCAKFYAPGIGRPSLPPGVYFRALLVGYFEGLGSERGIAWRVADSLSLRQFLGLPAGKDPPDHSTISRTRRLIDVDTHQAVFGWVLAALSEAGLVKGKTIGVDATTLEANAAMRSIVRRDDGRAYQTFLEDLARSSGIETPTREDLARVDRKRKKKGSNDDWTNPHDPDAQITKMKDGRTHLAYKQEHAVDMDTGAVVAVTVAGGAEGDTSTIEGTLDAAKQNLADAKDAAGAEGAQVDEPEEAVADKGYHSKAVALALRLGGWRTYISEPQRRQQRWPEERAARDAVYANRRRVGGGRGRALMRRRAELLERSFAHVLDTGGARRTHLRGQTNIAKRSLIQVAAFNLGLLMRKLFNVGKPRALQGALAALAAALVALLRLLWACGRVTPRERHLTSRGAESREMARRCALHVNAPRVAFTTAC
jgi:transposase